MKKIYLLLVQFALLGLPFSQVSADVEPLKPSPLRTGSALSQAADIELLGPLGDQWIEAFKEFRLSSVVQAELILSNNRIEHRISNVTDISKARNTDLLLVIYRENEQEFKMVVNPVQVHLIRQVPADDIQTGSL